jgi:anaerobic magnesium-protoporphyrin IX monomethyl ester cyclase
MKLLLIEANEDAWIGGRVGRGMHVVPVALLGLAAFVRRQVPDAEVRVVESSLAAASDRELAGLLADFEPDLVGIRSLNLFAHRVGWLVRSIRRWRSVPVVVGGPIAAALGSKLFAEVPELDLLAVGEGESTLARLVSGHSPAEIPGLLVRGPAGVAATGEAPCPSDLDALPFPDYSLIDLDHYAHQLSYAYNQRRQGVLLTSRGCPYRCTYCFQTSHAPVRLRSAANVFAEIERLALDHDVRDLYVVDDVFNLSRRRALEICERVARSGLGVRLYFVNGLRIDLCDEELLDRMVEAGTVWVTFGVETAHPRIAELIRKRVDLDRARDLVAYAQNLGMAVNIDTMFGFPTETPAEARATLDWLGSLPHPSLLPYHFNLRGYEGCEIVEQAAAAGWDREAFLATGSSSYHDLPLGTPSFSRSEMLAHLVEYHRRFGLSNREHLGWSIGVLRRIGYSDAELVDMYSVLLNRPVGSVTELAPTG